MIELLSLLFRALIKSCGSLQVALFLSHNPSCQNCSDFQEKPKVHGKETLSGSRLGPFLITITESKNCIDEIVEPTVSIILDF